MTQTSLILAKSEVLSACGVPKINIVNSSLSKQTKTDRGKNEIQKSIKKLEPR